MATHRLDRRGAFQHFEGHDVRIGTSILWRLCRKCWALEKEDVDRDQEGQTCLEEGSGILHCDSAWHRGMQLVNL